MEWKYHNWRRKGWGEVSESISSQSPLLWQPVVEKQFAIKKQNLTEPQHQCLLLHKTARLRTTEEVPTRLISGSGLYQVKFPAFPGSSWSHSVMKLVIQTLGGLSSL